MISGILKKYFEDNYKTNRVSHAFLICNTNYEKIKHDLLDIISFYFFDEEKIDENFVDFKVISPNNSIIKKEDITDLQEIFKTKSQIHKNKVYVIDGAEKMNEYASNSLLKFLEEPEEGIYAFLLSENVNKVLPTIKSRCQTIIISSSLQNELEDEKSDLLDAATDITMLIERKKIKSESYIYDIINKKEEKEKIKNIVNIIKNIYRSALNYKLFHKLDDFFDKEKYIKEISDLNKEEELINKLIVINKLENTLDYNLNIGLFLDRLIIELGDESNG